MAVPFYDNRKEIESLLNEWSGPLAELTHQPVLVNGKHTHLLEQEIISLTGIKHAIAVGNGTDALIIGLMAAGIGPGDEVIVPCYSFFASVSCILHVEATPVFVDIEPDTYNIDVALIEAAISKRTKAIMPVHLFCQMAAMPEISRIAREHNLIVFEDSAEATGMFQQDIHAGGFGLGGVLSFFPTKTLGALGDAGMILTNDSEFARQCRMRANLGRDESGIAQCIGLNSRMDEWHAMLLRARLTRLDQAIEARAKHASYLSRELSAIPQVLKTPELKVRGYTASRVDYVYLIETESRDALVAHLSKAGIITETYYPIPLHLQPVCRGLGYLQGDFPVAEQAATRVIGLPMYAELRQEQLDEIVAAIRAFFQEQ